MDKDKLATRLAQILNKFNTGERFTLDDLVEEFGVGKRTIQRDLHERLSYLPIKREDKFYFLEEYYLGKLNFKDIENFAILSGIQELYPSLGEDFLKKMLDNTINQAYIIKGHNYEDLSDKAEEFKIVEEAILNQYIIKFEYSDKNRVMQPYKFINSKGIWYVIGIESEILKTFSFKKVTHLQPTKEKFKIDKSVMETIQSDDSNWFSSKQIEVIVKVEKEVADYFSRRNILPNQMIIKNLSDGGLLVSTKVAFDEEILKLVRYWIPNVAIISPTYLQEKLENGLRGYLKI